MSWFVENSSTVHLLLALVAVGCGVFWWMQRRKKALIPAAIAVGLMALLYLLSLFVITDRQEIRNRVFTLANAVEKTNGDVFAQQLAKDFQWGVKDRDATRDFAMAKAKAHGVNDIHVWDIDVRELSREQMTAKVEFRMRARTKAGEVFPAFCRSTFKLEDGQWKMQEISFFNPVVNNQPIGIPN